MVGTAAYHYGRPTPNSTPLKSNPFLKATLFSKQPVSQSNPFHVQERAFMLNEIERTTGRGIKTRLYLIGRAEA
jgi:hypothetical protein